MKFNIPEQMPTRYEFASELFGAVFPDLEALGYQRTGYGYANACRHAVDELGLLVDDVEFRLTEDTDLFRLIYEISKSNETLFKKLPALIKDCEYETYVSSQAVNSFLVTDGILKTWVAEKTKDNYTNRVNNPFEASLFFSYLLFSRSVCEESRKAFFKKCLGYVGITDIEETLECKLYNFDWKELGKENGAEINKKCFTRLENKAIVLCSAVILAVFTMLGDYSKDKYAAEFEKLYAMFKSTFEGDVAAKNSMERAEREFYKKIKFFEPRSIQTTKKLYPQDLFVLPVFNLNGVECELPLSDLSGASNSKRLMVVAKTGMGKSAFLQMVSLSMLYKKYGENEKSLDALQKIAGKLKTPDDMFIISVPARMFSYCFVDDRYKAWTNDFVKLFFNCMWRLSSVDFYSTSALEKVISEDEIRPTASNLVNDQFIECVKDYARRGKLLLILDSFDEISSGDMRNAYLKAVSSFYDNYCRYHENGEVGAHVIMSSREMSPETMSELERRLMIDPASNRYGICALNQSQRGELIRNWNRTKGIDFEETEEMISQIEKNHYFLDYSVNPYMLSVVCFYFGFDLGDITQRYINTLSDKIRGSVKTDDTIITNVLMDLVKILQDLAGETVTTGKSHFSRRDLNRYLNRAMNKNELSEEDIAEYIEILHEIFVTGVGLIVPADGSDSDYQFINDQIRFELAAKGIQRALDNDEKAIAYRDVILPSINNADEYVGLLIPLICDINLENVKLAEILVSDLVMYDFAGDHANEEILIRAMLDLLLNRYGSNIATSARPGRNDTKYVRRAQRMLMMRVLTSRCLNLSDDEKAELAETPAYKENREWFSDNVSSLLQ